jgi:hypothetical protein
MGASLTSPARAGLDSPVMDEPIHANESRFWDDVTDWLLDRPSRLPMPLSDEEIEALLRYAHEGREPRHDGS